MPTFSLPFLSPSMSETHILASNFFSACCIVYNPNANFRGEIGDGTEEQLMGVFNAALFRKYLFIDIKFNQ